MVPAVHSKRCRGNRDEAGGADGHGLAELDGPRTEPVIVPLIVPSPTKPPLPVKPKSIVEPAAAVKVLVPSYVAKSKSRMPDWSTIVPPSLTKN